MDVFVLHLLNGLSFGFILFLLASGLSLIMGVMGTINLAHGALYMVGAYVGFTIVVQHGLNYGLAVLAGGIVGGLIGLLIERGFLSRLYRQPLEQVLLTIGFVYILTNLCLLVWGGEVMRPFTAPWLSGSLNILGWTYPVTRVSIIPTGLMFAIGLWWLQEKTRVGAIIRAGMDDKEMTTGLGINLMRYSNAVFLLGSFMAGVAGVIGAQLLGISSDLAWNVLLLSLIVIVVGGMGSIQGAVLGAMMIGLIDSFGKALFPQLAHIIPYLAMVVILVIRPSGLLGRRV